VRRSSTRAVYTLIDERGVFSPQWPTVPHSPVSPSIASLPLQALLIGINYASTASDNEHGCRELKGLANDAKEMKKTLIGADSALALLFAC
jgi:hypothetical protein